MSPEKSPQDPKQANTDAKLAEDSIETSSPADEGSSRSQISGPVSGTSIVSWDELMKTRSGDGTGFDLEEVSRVHTRSETELFAPEPKPHSAGGDSLHEMEVDEIPFFPDDSSTVDLNSAPFIDLPFPTEEHAQAETHANLLHDPHPAHESESGRLDLTGPDSDLPASPSAVTAIESGIIHRLDEHDTMPLQAPRSRRASLINGLVGGLVGGVLLCAGLWVMRSGTKLNAAATPAPAPVANEAFANLLAAEDLDQAIATLEQNPSSPLKGLLTKAKQDADQLKIHEADLATLREDSAKLKQEQQNLAGETIKLKALVAAAKTDFQAAEAKAESYRLAEENAKKAAEIVQTLANNATKESTTKLALAEQAKTAAEEKLKKVEVQLASIKPVKPLIEEADLTRLKTERQRFAEEAKTLEVKLAEANRSHESLKHSVTVLNDFSRQVRQKFQLAHNAPTADLLTAIDQALSRPRSELPLLPYTQLGGPQADRIYGQGLTKYRNGQYVEAEHDFVNAIRGNDSDARYWYFLGLTRYALGKSEQAEEALRQGGEREQRNLPHSSLVDKSLERLPIQARAIISPYRGRS